MKYKHIVKVFIVIVAVIFVLIQFIQPNRDNPQFDPAKTMQAELQAPANIVALLNRGCVDCHSNETRWPFYAYIAPASWLVAYDVSEGRKHFNMSEWGKYRLSKKVSILGGINSAVKENEMPLPKYIPLHPEADFSDAERDTLAAWAQSAGEKMMGGDEEE